MKALNHQKTETGRSFEHTFISDKKSRNGVEKTSINRTNITIRGRVNAADMSKPPMFIVKGGNVSSSLQIIKLEIQICFNFMLPNHKEKIKQRSL